MNSFIKLLVTLNILNVIDAIQTYICVNQYVCYDFNPFVNHVWFYVIKITAGMGVSIFYYYVYTRSNDFNKKLAYFFVVFLSALYMLTIINNTLHFLNIHS